MISRFFKEHSDALTLLTISAAGAAVLTSLLWCYDKDEVFNYKKYIILGITGALLFPLPFINCSSNEGWSPEMNSDIENDRSKLDAPANKLR